MSARGFFAAIISSVRAAPDGVYGGLLAAFQRTDDFFDHTVFDEGLQRFGDSRCDRLIETPRATARYSGGILQIP
jgi:hypothetical protein